MRSSQCWCPFGPDPEAANTCRAAEPGSPPGDSLSAALLERLEDGLCHVFLLLEGLVKIALDTRLDLAVLSLGFHVGVGSTSFATLATDTRVPSVGLLLDVKGSASSRNRSRSCCHLRVDRLGRDLTIAHAHPHAHDGVGMGEPDTTGGRGSAFAELLWILHRPVLLRLRLGIQLRPWRGLLLKRLRGLAVTLKMLAALSHDDGRIHGVRDGQTKGGSSHEDARADLLHAAVAEVEADNRHATVEALDVPSAENVEGKELADVQPARREESKCSSALLNLKWKQVSRVPRRLDSENDGERGKNGSA